MITFLKEYFRITVKGHIPAFSSFKYYKEWKRLLNANSTDEKLPWITFQAIEFISRNMHSNYKVFEFGGGGSTLFFLDKVEKVVTIEHNQEWFSILQQKINNSDYARWNGQLILPEQPVDTSNLDKAKPLDSFSHSPVFKDATFRTYSTAISQYKDAYFDIVLIDGRARTSCLHFAIPKVKVGGYLVLDNSERAYYLTNNAALLNKHYRLVLKETGPVPYSAFFSQTTIWQRVV